LKVDAEGKVKVHDAAWQPWNQWSDQAPWQ